MVMVVWDCTGGWRRFLVLYRWLKALLERRDVFGDRGAGRRHWVMCIVAPVIIGYYEICVGDVGFREFECQVAQGEMSSEVYRNPRLLLLLS